ncbi:MAG: hypothetical protein HY901_05555 [Deltaproteobacteria bacterium]|nr:hypothetical protein [Deltaproteobacteria bacterium]
MKRALVLAVVGGFLGIVTGSLLGPWFLSWYSEPSLPSTFSCTKEIDWAMDRLVKTQLASALIGAIVVGVAGTLIARALRLRAARKAAAGGGAPTQA